MNEYYSLIGLAIFVIPIVILTIIADRIDNNRKGEIMKIKMPNINDRVRFRTEHHTIEGTVDHVQKIGKCRVKTDDGAYYLVDSEECEILTGVNE